MTAEHDQHQWVGVHLLAEFSSSQRTAEHHQHQRVLASPARTTAEHDQHQWVEVQLLAEFSTSQRAAEHHQHHGRQPNMISISGLGSTFLQNFQLAIEQPSISSISGFWLHQRRRNPNIISISGLAVHLLAEFSTSQRAAEHHQHQRVLASPARTTVEHDQHQWVGRSCRIFN